MKQKFTMRYILSLLLFVSFSLNGQIAVDGLYSDWDDIETKVVEDDDFPGLDILSLSVSNDDENLYLKIETEEFFDLQDDEFISVFIDADNNSNTGFEADGLGSEITYYFGNKNSYINYPNGTFNGNHNDLRLIALPTVTSNVFEIAIKRSLTTFQGTMTMGDIISISVNNGNNGDVIPNQSGGMEYEMMPLSSYPSNYSLNKTNASFSRVMSWNVLNDGFLDPSREDHIKDVIKGMNPDVIAFQEVYGTPMEDIADFLNDALPNTDGSSWQYAKTGPDVAVFTRDYLEAFDNIDGNGVFLLYDDDNNPMIVYNVHLPCCDNDVSRQLEIDKILSVLRDKNTGFIYEDDAPIIITGDFNMVGLVQNVESFLNGDIVNESQYGIDFNPDWDGSSLEDANPYVTGYPANYTWINKNGNYNPGKLDWMFYSGSVMNRQNSFVLNTEFLLESELSALNLDRDATELASDHLPIIVDFSFGAVDADMDGFNSDVDCDDNDASINPDAEEIANNDVDEDCDGVALIIDVDMDGFNSDDDCNDEDASINPDAEEIANNDVDEDCDGVALIIDVDMDGFNSDVDCDDNDASINPDAEEIANNDVDEDCDGLALIIDVDMDGFNSDDDCDDQDASINSDAEEIANNDIDEDCDGEALIIDVDMDGFNSDDDCDDEDASINPDAEEIANNDIDEDCDGEALIIDVDMDGFNSDDDCDDEDASINPDAEEIANNNIDEDCDGEALIIDVDMDGFNSDVDCDDLDSLINPMATEIPNNGIDEDCDGFDLITSVNTEELIQFNIFPNPAKDFVGVEIEVFGEYNLSIFDGMGQKVSNRLISSTNTSIDISELAKGVYFLQLKNESGEIAVKKLVVLE